MAKLSPLVSSVGFLGQAAHLGADVAQEEEGNGRHGAGHFSDPEGCVPAVVLSDGTEWQS